MWYYCAVTGESKKIVFTSGATEKITSGEAWQPCPAALPGSLYRQPCPAALPGSLARQPCSVFSEHFKVIKSAYLF
jgi:hypothetical protein